MDYNPVTTALALLRFFEPTEAIRYAEGVASTGSELIRREYEAAAEIIRQRTKLEG